MLSPAQHQQQPQQPTQPQQPHSARDRDRDHRERSHRSHRDSVRQTAPSRSAPASPAVDITGSLVVAASKSNDPDELVRVARAMVGVDNVAAEACFTRALALNPAHTKALATFAIFCETILRDYARAETFYKNAAFSGQAIHLQNYAEFLKNIRKNDVMAAKLLTAAEEAKQRGAATASLVAVGARPPPPTKSDDAPPPLPSPHSTVADDAEPRVSRSGKHSSRRSSSSRTKSKRADDNE
jgi:hypothetical protein